MATGILASEGQAGLVMRRHWRHQGRKLVAALTLVGGVDFLFSLY
jgi:hypothetical protein